MHVTRQHHRRVVSSLWIAVIVLSILLILALTKVDVFYVDKPPATQSRDAASRYLEAVPTGFLEEEEAVIVDDVALPVTKVLFEYVKVVNGCGPHFEGECLNVRSGPGTDYPVVAQLRNNIILKVGGKVERDGSTWIKIVFDEWLRYPERIQGDWYVAAEHLEAVLDEGDMTIWQGENATSTKEIIVDRSDQKLYAYNEDGGLFMETYISTGLELTPTPRGIFTIFKKTPSRYMQGPLPGISNQYYDLPGVPWNLYFTHQGAVIHGAYWHTNFGSPYSHGCVNVAPDEAQKLYNWADLGTRVVVRD